MWSPLTAFFMMSGIDVIVFTSKKNHFLLFLLLACPTALQSSRTQISEPREWIWEQMKGWTASWVVVVGVVTYLIYHNCRGSPVGQPGLALPPLTSSMWMQA